MNTGLANDSGDPCPLVSEDHREEDSIACPEGRAWCLPGAGKIAEGSSNIRFNDF